MGTSAFLGIPGWRIPTRFFGKKELNTFLAPTIRTLPRNNKNSNYWVEPYEVAIFIGQKD